MKNIFFLCSFFLSIVCFSQEIPVTKKTPSTLKKHKVSILDDYTWLEDMKSKEVTNWANAQNAAVNQQFLEIKKTYSPASTIKEYDSKTTYSLPDRKNKYFYKFYRNKNKSSSLFFMKTLDDFPVEIVNPNKIYADKNVTINGYYPSRNSILLAYKISIDGSDKHEIRFVDLNKNSAKDDILKDVKFSNVSWNNDQGIFYKKNINKDLFAKDSTFQLFYHKIGTQQEQDKLIFDTSKEEADISFFTSRDRLFIIEKNKKETLKNYYYANLKEDTIQLEKFIENDSTDFKFINYKNGRVYFSSNEYNWGEVRSFNLLNRKDETIIIPQIYTHLLLGTYLSDEYIICKYKTTGKNYFILYDYAGKLVRKIDVPNGMDIDMMYLDPVTKDFYFGVRSYVLPYRNFKMNILTGIEESFYSRNNKPKPTLFPLYYFETKTITYKSRDNVDIPITIVHKKGLPLDGNNPTLLKAYGGFGAVSSSSYDTGLLYFLEKGGVFAYAEIRGGGEKGLKWHTDGKGLKKMNTFNDFIDAAEFLIKENYTSPGKLAITGGSQGGLLVGVAMTKRPELFKVAIPVVGAFDMLKFDQYTVGRMHLDEYGNPEKENEFNALMKYSPYHNIADNVNYPITLIITSENDDRVPPFHSYKFAAKLQNRSAQKNPVYLQTIKNAGHSRNSTYENKVEEKAEFYSFLLYHLNQ